MSINKTGAVLVAIILTSFLSTTNAQAIPEDDPVVLALHQIRQQKYTEAVKHLDSVCQNKNTPLDAHKIEDLPCALYRLASGEISKPSKPESQADIYWLLGVTAYEAMRYNYAILLFEISRVFNPKEVETYRSLAKLYRDTKEYDKSNDYYLEAFKLDPKSIHSYYWIATNEYDRGNFQEALNWLDKAYAIDPKDGRLYFRKGQIEMKRGNYDEAIKLLKDSIALNVDKKAADPLIKECKELKKTNVK